MIIYNLLQYAFGKVKALSETGQDQNALISVCASLFTATAKNVFGWETGY